MVEGFAKFAKYAMFFVNFVILILGVLMLIIIVLPMSKKNSAEKKSEDNIGQTVLMAAVSIVILLSFLGCCGAFWEQKCILLLFSILMSLILILMIVGLCLGIKFREKGKDSLRAGYKNFMKHYANDSLSKKLMDDAQNWYQCCGVTDNETTVSWQNWAKLNKKEFGGKVKVPESCCKDKNKLKECTENPTESNAYLFDCVKKFQEYTKKNTKILLYIVGGIIFTLVMGIFFSCTLYCQIREEVDFSRY